MMRWIVIGFCWLVALAAQGARWSLQQSAIAVHDQPIGDTVVVDRARTPEPGVLAVVNSLYGKPYFEHILDQVDLPRAGTYTQVQMSIAQYSLGSSQAPEGTEGILSPGSLVYAVLMVPKAPGETPEPMRDITGKPLAHPFRLQ